MPVLAQGERSPTSTGGTQYYQEWTSKHMRHLCSRFEKPSQQKLLMNVERKSKYPFIILCTPEPNSSSSASKSSMSSMNKARAYHREISQHSAYSLEDEEDDEEDEEAHWITQKQRDSINNHYLPPPPPPLLMPHIWPEIRYIDGLYTVCASIVRPGSGVADDFDESLYLGQERNAPGVGGGGWKRHASTNVIRCSLCEIALRPWESFRYEPDQISFAKGDIGEARLRSWIGGEINGGWR